MRKSGGKWGKNEKNMSKMSKNGRKNGVKMGKNEKKNEGEMTIKTKIDKNEFFFFFFFFFFFGNF
jgi:hypothetical protein